MNNAIRNLKTNSHDGGGFMVYADDFDETPDCFKEYM